MIDKWLLLHGPQIQGAYQHYSSVCRRLLGLPSPSWCTWALCFGCCGKYAEILRKSYVLFRPRREQLKWIILMYRSWRQTFTWISLSRHLINFFLFIISESIQILLESTGCCFGLNHWANQIHSERDAGVRNTVLPFYAALAFIWKGRKVQQAEP